MGREKISVEDDAKLLVRWPVLRGRKGEFAIVDPFPGARRRRIEPDLLQRGILQVLQARRGFAKLDSERRNLQLFLERRDRDRRYFGVDHVRLRPVLIPAPAPDRAAGDY